MLPDRFLQRKKDVLLKIDKSSIGCWDEKISGLCEKINSMKNYYTTSSCSGRIVLMIDQNKKQKGLFIRIYHDEISFKQLKKDLMDIANHPNPPTRNLRSQVRDINKKELTQKSSRDNLFLNGNKIKFKLEPCILHVLCRSLKGAKALYEKAKLAGWKDSKMVSWERNFVIELTSTERLEFPIINKNKILVDDVFLKMIVDNSNKKLKRSWERIEKLKFLI